MAQFRVLAAADVTHILGAFGLAPTDYISHQPIAAGTINTNVRVDTTQGLRFLRVNEGKSADDVAREAAIVGHVSVRGVPTPVPQKTATGEPFARWGGQIVSLFPWLPGRTLARSAVTVEHARHVGHALARLHQAGTAFPDRGASRYEPSEIESRIERIAAHAAHDPLLVDAVRDLRPELAALRSQREPGPSTETTGLQQAGLIHGDLFIDNVLFDGDQMVALLDFEQASWGRLAYDLAVTTLAWGFGHDDFRPEIVRALFDGYNGVRRLDSGERAAFGCELRFAACRFAVTRITDVYMKRGAGAAPGKDFRRYLQRLARVREHLASGDNLLLPPG
ncbi:MAG: homoserine kinase [Deltaproteobacteria bacterium]|nr:homoserine kinase [Deltaproteobacteria bacterium]